MESWIFKPREKQPTKFNIRGGIGKRGAIDIVIFTGTVKAITCRYCFILDKGLIHNIAYSVLLYIVIL